MVTEKFQINWGTYLATSKNIIYGMIDGRGSGGRGDKFLHELYHKLGTLEVDDQILGVKYLRDKLSYIKKEAIGIWGWSYGGYVSSMALVKDKNKVFSCGLSVAPVTSWLLYDSVYTERYMGLPRDNMNSYLEADLLNKAKEFKGKKYKLIHGTADDNVHFQQSLLLMRSLTNHNIIYETQIYPDQNHALSGVKLHLYKLMESFWEDCFKIYNPETSNLQRKRNLQRNRQ